MVVQGQDSALPRTQQTQHSQTDFIKQNKKSRN